MNNKHATRFSRIKRQGLLVYFIPYTKEPGEDTISTRIPLLYSVLKEYAEVQRAPQLSNTKFFLFNRILLLIKSTRSIFRALKDREKIIVFGSDQPAGLIATVLGTLIKYMQKDRDVRVVYDSHGSRYKLSLDLNPPIIYKVINIFEDSLSIKMADLIIVPTYADKVIYAQYTRKKKDLVVLPY